ncbi:MAG TPA: hypothetical protein VE684_18995 [Crenalkalicoccus sp.]|nr:hypothetical protein [Crenalkalicoccus sp.]
MPSRLALLLLALALTGCDGTGLGVGAAVTVGSVATIGRTPVDAVVSLVSGRDCSAVRLDRGLSYCRPEEAPPAPPPYCTRSLGRADCWTRPPPGLPPPRGIADGPATLTPAQEADRTRRWPGLF